MEQCVGSAVVVGCSIWGYGMVLSRSGPASNRDRRSVLFWVCVVFFRSCIAEKRGAESGYID